MRALTVAIGLFVLLSSFARAEDIACRSYKFGPHFTEWVERGEQRGARIVVRDPKWQLDALGWHATSTAYCQACFGEEIAEAVLWLVARDPADRDIESALTTEAVARTMFGFPFQVSDAHFRAKTDTTTASIGELEGRARVIGIESRDGRSNEIIALFVGKGCVSLFGILYANGGAEIAIDRWGAFAQATGIEWYKPPPDAHILNPPPRPPADEFPLGDAFRRRYLEKP